jgi:hypothetical protein
MKNILLIGCFIFIASCMETNNPVCNCGCVSCSIISNGLVVCYPFDGNGNCQIEKFLFYIITETNFNIQVGITN